MNVTSEAAAAVTASAADSHQADLPGPITQVPPDPASVRSGLDTLIVIAPPAYIS